MRILMEEYGRILVTVLIAGILLGSIFVGFMDKWKESGGVNDSTKTQFASDEEKRTPPLLLAKDFKVRQGEELRMSDYISAVDFDGRDLSELIQMTYEETVAGIRRYDLMVRSPITGKTARRKMVVLLDSRIPEGGGFECG